jgi:hypothetical protein
LVGGRHFLLNENGGLLGFEEEDAPAADAEAVVGRLGRAADLDGVLVDDFAEGLGVVLRVVDVPAEGLEEGIEEVAPQQGFVVAAAAISVEVGFESLDELADDGGSGHRRNVSRMAPTAPAFRPASASPPTAPAI